MGSVGMSEIEHITLTGEIRRETDLAILFWDGEKEYWLPKSQIEDRCNYSDGVEITIPRWLGEEKEII
jgi:hypothetical protein